MGHRVANSPTHAISPTPSSPPKSDVRGIALNVVSPEIISIKQLADMVTERFPTDVTYGQPRPGDVPPSYVSAARIEEKLGWKTEVSFEEGMAELLSADRG